MSILNLRKSLVCASSILIIAGSAIHTANAQPYWENSSNEIVRTSFGECWRTSDWTAESAVPECGGAVKKPEAVAVVIGDKDGDGVNDDNDQCPNTAAGKEVDSRGCVVIKDSDGDGVVDAKDECPNTAKGVVTNSQGCVLKANIELSNVEFATGTSTLSAASQSKLDDVAATLVKNDHLNFEVAGHTDSVGNHARNVSLSQRRADAVRLYLVNKGVAENRLSAKGYGPDKPAASNDTADGRASNRRVELVIK